MHTAGTNLVIANLLSRNFSTMSAKKYQLQLETVSVRPLIELAELQLDNSLKQIHYLVKHKEIIPTQTRVAYAVKESA